MALRGRGGVESVLQSRGPWLQSNCASERDRLTAAPRPRRAAQIVMAPPRVVGWPASPAAGSTSTSAARYLACAASATARCRDVAGCDVVGSSATMRRTAPLRAAARGSGWGAPIICTCSSSSAARLRDALATAAQRITACDADFWSEHTCEEYADGGHGRPQLGGVVRRRRASTVARRATPTLSSLRIRAGPTR